MKKKNIKIVVVIALCICGIFIGVKIYNSSQLSVYDSVIEARYKESNKIGYSIKQIKKILEEYNYDYFNNIARIEYGWMVSSGNLSKHEMDAINRDYIKFSKSKEKDIDIDIEELALGVGVLKFFNGEHDEAITMVQKLEKSKNEEIKAMATLNLALMEMNLYNFEKSLDILKRDYDCEFYNFYRDRIVAFEKYLIKGEISEIKKYEEFIINKKPVNENLEVYLNSLSGIRENIQCMIAYSNERKSTNNTLSGVIRDGDKPLRGIVIELKDISYTGMRSGPYVGEEIFAITDKNGYYKIENIPNGTYRVGVTGFNSVFRGKELKKSKELNFSGYTAMKEDIVLNDSIKIKELKYIDKNKIKISWEYFGEEPIEYDIGFSEIMIDSAGRESVNSFVYPLIQTKEKEITININDLKKNSIGNISTWSDGKANADNIMEVGYHGGEYVVKIYAARDESKYSYFGSDNYGIVSPKEYKSIEIKGEKWNEGDKLILDGKYENAIKWFEESYKKDSTNLHTLKILSTLNSDIFEFEDEYERGSYDSYKGIKYTEELKKQIGSNYTIEYRLAKLYEEIGEYTKSKEHYRKLVEEYEAYYEYKSIARVFLKEDNYEEALYNFKLFDENWTYDNTYSETITLSILLDKEKTIREYREMIDYRYKASLEEYLSMDRSRYEKMYEYMKIGNIKEAKKLLENDNSDLGKLYKALFIACDSYVDSKPGKKEEYDAIYRSMESETLSKILLFLGNEIR